MAKKLRWRLAGAALGLLLAWGAAACAGPHEDGISQAMDDMKKGEHDPFRLTSHILKNGARIPRAYACPARGGEDISLPLTWKFPPKGTKAFALTMLDPDAPDGPAVHWAIMNLPAGSTSLSTDAAAKKLPGSAWATLNYLGKVGYAGPCPPADQRHVYIFTLSALKKKLDKPKGHVALADILDELDAKTIGSTSLSGYFPTAE